MADVAPATSVHQDLGFGFGLAALSGGRDGGWRQALSWVQARYSLEVKASCIPPCVPPGSVVGWRNGLPLTNESAAASCLRKRRELHFVEPTAEALDEGARDRLARTM